MTPNMPWLNEEFVPVVDPEDLKSAWNLRHELGVPEDFSISREHYALVLTTFGCFSDRKILVDSNHTEA
jgi:hypothetical protein